MGDTGHCAHLPPLASGLNPLYSHPDSELTLVTSQGKIKTFSRNNEPSLAATPAKLSLKEHCMKNEIKNNQNSV